MQKKRPNNANNSIRYIMVSLRSALLKTILIYN